MLGRFSEEPQITLLQKHFPQHEALQFIAETVARKYTTIPLANNDDTSVVATANSSDIPASEASTNRAQMRIEPQAVTTEGIQVAIETGATFCRDRNNLSHTELSGAIKQVYQEEHKDNPLDESEEAVDLVIPPTDKASRLFGIVCKIEELLGNNTYSTLSLQQFTGSWKRGVTINVVSNHRNIPQLLDDLKNIPGVEQIEERQTATGDSPSHLEESKVWPNPKICVRTRLLVTLRQPSMAPQEPETILN
ncbi:hypothetical protein ACFLV4_05240 [Chloroflexota bacterium]